MKTHPSKWTGDERAVTIDAMNGPVVFVHERFVIRCREQTLGTELTIHRIEQRPSGAVEILPRGYIEGVNFIRVKRA